MIEGHSIHDVSIADFDFSKLYPKSSTVAIAPISSKNEPPTKKLWFQEALEGVNEGKRNDTATRLAGRYAHIGLIRQETELLMSKWNEQNSPPMDDKELSATIKSIYEKENQQQQMDRQELLETISTVIGITLNSVRKIRSDNSSSTNIEMVFDKGVCSITNNDLHNAAHFQRELSAATGHVVKRLGKNTIISHEQLIQMILDAAEVVSLDESATEKGETLTYIRRYIRHNHVCPEIVDEEDTPEHGAFRYNRVIWFDIHEMFTLLFSAHKPTWSSKTLAVRLERLNLEKRDFKGKQHYGITYEMAGWKENMEFEYDERQVTPVGRQS